MMIREDESLLQALLNSPRLPEYAYEIQSILAEEARRRQQFYQQMDESEKVEFINGEIVVHSPVKLRHNAAAGHLYRLLSTYVIFHGLGYVGYEKILISLTRNDYEPDICFFGQEKAAQFQPDQMRFPAPDLVVEVLSASTEAVDRGVKFEDYAAHGVTEYWLIDPETETAEQYHLQDGSYTLHVKAQTGQLTSHVIADFVIPIRAIFDEQENQAALYQLLSTDSGPRNTA
jgi:Uma2 family endonuclease